VAGLLKFGFWKMEGLRSKLRNKDFKRGAKDCDVIGTARRKRGGGLYIEVIEYEVYSKHRITVSCFKTDIILNTKSYSDMWFWKIRPSFPKLKLSLKDTVLINDKSSYSYTE
jgi:hypothetical protein